MKSVWNGSISFGLVNIPVRLYSAVEPKMLGFRMLCGNCKNSLRYKRWCSTCEKEVKWEDVIKGIEIRKGKYFILDKDNLSKLRPEKTQRIEIIKFIDTFRIDPIYYDRHYYVAPEKAKDKAYFLFREVLQAAGKVGVGRFVMREKEYVCAVEAYKTGLLLTALNYKYEVRDIGRLEELKETPKLGKEELSLAKMIIDKFYQEDFDISAFKDTFAEKLKELVKKLERGEEITVKRSRSKPEKTLIEALKASLK